MIGVLKETIKDAEEKTAQGNFDWARNLIRNAYQKATTIISIGPSGAAVTGDENANISWKVFKIIGIFMLVVLALSVLFFGGYYGYEYSVLSKLRSKRQSIGSIIAATLSTRMTRQRSGNVRIPTPPAKPDFPIPCITIPIVTKIQNITGCVPGIISCLTKSLIVSIIFFVVLLFTV